MLQEPKKSSEFPASQSFQQVSTQGRNYLELYVGFEQLTIDLMIVISSEWVVVFEMVEGREKVVSTFGYSDLKLARVACEENREQCNYST